MSEKNNGNPDTASQTITTGAVHPSENAALQEVSTWPLALTDGGTFPDGVVIVVYMRPERVHGLKEAKASQKKPNPAAGIFKSFNTGSWYFASEFLDRIGGIAESQCAGLKVRPAKVEVTFVLDDKAYRNVGVILESFDEAYRGL